MVDSVDSSLVALDFDVLRSALAASAQTPMARLVIASLRPLPSLAAVHLALDETGEALVLLRSGRPVATADVRDVLAPVKRASMGEILDAPTLCAIGSSMAALVALRRSLAVAGDVAPTLAAISEAIDIDPSVAADLVESFAPDGTLSVERWPELGPLREAVASLHARVRDTLEKLVHGDTLADVLQDTFWTLRENRYVIPVRTDSGRWDLGVVHDTSNSGKTAFVEPHAVLALDNRRKLAEAELRSAEHRILGILSRAAGGEAAGFDDAIDAALRIDLAGARAGLASKLGANRPKVGAEGVVQLVAARHPVLLLRGVDVVANDLTVDTAHPILVVSGANAGGKTVALKTIGLCAALVAHGCFVPATANSRVDRFEHVLAAIGDAQSVTGDRSSFSGHVSWLAEHLPMAGPDALLLLDELCTGTDPAQGAALARAVLEHLLQVGTRVVATTHYASLKALSAVDPRFAVSAVQQVGGRPTFVVRPGLSGESFAMDVARHCGLPEAVVARAEVVLAEERGASGSLVDALEAEVGRARAEVAAVLAQRDALVRRGAELDLRQAALDRRAQGVVDAASKDLLERIRGAEEAVGRVVADLQRAPSPVTVRSSRMALEALRGLVPAPSAPDPGDETAPPVGSRVRDTRLSAVGEVIAVGTEGVVVRIGGITRVAKASELIRLSDLPAKAPTPVRSKTSARQVDMEQVVRTTASTVDLRGMRVDEGLDAVDAFLGRLTSDEMDTGFILHGHGTGAMKDGVRRWLRTHPTVLSCGPAHSDQGGDAYTVVRLRP